MVKQKGLSLGTGQQPKQGLPVDGSPSPPHRVVPVVDVLADLVAGLAIAGLDLALELIPSPIDYVDVVIGQPTPLFFDLTLDLLPIAFDSVPVHRNLSSLL